MDKSYPVERLRRVITDIIAAVGLDPEMAVVFADSIVAADLRGVKSHGTIRVPDYVRRVENGAWIPGPPYDSCATKAPSACSTAETVSDRSPGITPCSAAIEKGGTHGIGLVAVRNSNHFGIASFYAMTALEAGMIGVVLTNRRPAMNPYGSISPLLGTNPIAVAVPAGTENPIVLDMSTSIVARGKIRFAALTGKEIPLGWATDAAGGPTTDAQKALKGSLEPIGGAKGSGLSLVVDILCGVLTNSCLTGEVKTILDISGPAKTGHIFAALDIAHFIEADFFRKNMDAIIQRIKSLPPKGGQEIFLPGEIEFNLAEKRVRRASRLKMPLFRTSTSWPRGTTAIGWNDF